MSGASRREFLRHAGAFALLHGAAPLGLQLAATAASAAQTRPRDYRAIVCLFMYGANDAHNTLVPITPDAWRSYAEARSALALPRESLLPVAGGRLGLHPSLAPLQALYDRGEAAILANVGPLLVPISDASEYLRTNVPRPPKLFSHNDQQAMWQAFSPEGAKTGWGGRIADRLAGSNGGPLFTAVSASESAIFLAGEHSLPYQIGNSGPIGFNRLQAGTLFGSPAGSAALRAQIMAAGNGPIGSDYAALVQRSLQAHEVLTAALARLPESDPRVALPGGLEQDRLARQLRIVARLIGVRDAPGVAQRRQVFFVSLGGFDTHDNELERHAKLLDSVARSVGWFQQAMKALGCAEAVTLFTASDFGRALLSNGDGSDHGWGGHHFIVGGAVRGGLYGDFPEVALRTRTDVGNGRLLPTTSVSQYAATLARWMGVPGSELPALLPGLASFDRRDLGFLRT